MNTPPAAAEFEIFLSYSRQDNVPVRAGEEGWVTALRDAILTDHRRFSTESLRIFFDAHDIRTMDDWRHLILQGLRHSRILLVCLSPNYFRSDPCRWEWEEYTRRQVHALMGQDSIATVYFVEVPGTDEQANAAGLTEWLAATLRPNFTDLRPWFPTGAAALREEAVRRHVESLGSSLWERIQRARRATGVPGNLRRHNPHFVGRQTELRRLHESLALGAVGVVTAVHGLGGQGKTELATAYAHGWADWYPAGLWVLGAEGRTELLPLLGELAGELGIPLSAGPEETAAQRGRRVLAELHRRAALRKGPEPEREAACLVVLDNVSDPALLSEPQLAQLPRESWLRVVATTRLGEDALPASRKASLAFVAVDSLLEEDAVALLRDHQPGAQWTHPGDEAAALELVHELGSFTLAVEAVALYLGLHPEVRPADYLARLRREGLAGADTLGSDPDVAAQLAHREKQLALVLDATLARLEPPARTALDYAALLPPDHLPWPWLRALVEQEHPGALDFRPGYPDPWQLLRRRLEGLRLLTPGDHVEISRLHRLVGAHLAARLEPAARERRLSALRARVEAFALELQTAWRHDPAALWQLVPLQEAALLWQTGVKDVRLAHIAGIAGDIERTVGRLDVAAPLLRLSHEIARGLHQANPTSAEAARDVSVSLNKLGDLYGVRGQAGDAMAALRCCEESLEIARQLRAANPSSAQAARDVSVSLNQLGDLYRARGQAGDAMAALRCGEESLEIDRQLRAANPTSAQAARDVSVSLERLGDLYGVRGQAGDAEAALRCFEETLEIHRQLRAANPSSAEAARDVSVSLNQLGDLYRVRGQAGDAEAALRCFEETLEIARQLRAANPTSAQAARDVSVSLNRLGDLYGVRGQAGDAEAALRCYEEGLEIARQLRAANPTSAEAARDVSVSLNQLGDLYGVRGQAGDAEAALRCYEESLEIARQLRAANPTSAQAARDVSVSLNQLGDLYGVRGQAGDAAAALRCCEESLEIARQLRAANPTSAQAARDASVSLNKLGDLYGVRGQAGDAAAALRCCEESLEIARQLRAANPTSAEAARDVSVSLERLGGLYRVRGQAGDAEAALRCYEEGLEIDRQLRTANPASAEAARDVSVSLERLGDLYGVRGQAGDAAAALRCFEETLEIRRQLRAASPGATEGARDVAVSLNNLGDFYRARGQEGDAEAALRSFEESLEICRQLRTANPNSAQAARDVWAENCWKLAELVEQSGQGDASTWWRGAFEVLSGLEAAGAVLSAADQRALEHLRRRVTAAP